MRFLAAILGLAVCVWTTACGPAPAPRPGAVAEPETAGQTPTSSASTAAGPENESMQFKDAPGWTLPVPDLEYNAREGRAIFLHYCAPCHGVEGHGDGFNAYNLDPKPRDLSDPEFQRERSTKDLADIVRSGGGVAGLSTGMPPWGRTLKDRQVLNVVRFVRTLVREEEQDAD